MRFVLPGGRRSVVRTPLCLVDSVSHIFFLLKTDSLAVLGHDKALIDNLVRVNKI